MEAFTSDGTLSLPEQSAAGAARLHFRRWRPAGEAKAAVLLSHGYAEHVGRYEHVAAALNRAGYDVFAVDHWGHGRSDGVPGHAPAFSVYLDGMDALLARARSEAPGKKLFLIGHSMGGLVAANYLIARQGAFVGAVLSGPSLKPVDEPPAAVMMIGRLLSKLAPKAGLVSLDANLVSRDPAVVAAYVGDPLVYRGKISARLGAVMVDAMRDALEGAAAINLPLLILHGGEDRLTSPDGSREFAARVSSGDKTLKIYDGFYHEIFNDPGKDGVIADVIAWLDARA